MLILIAESKSMRTPKMEVPAEAIASHSPMFLPEAGSIVDGLRGMDAAEIAVRLKLGPQNAARLVREVYEFHNASLSLPAIDAFDGIVFRALDFTSLSDDALSRLNGRVRIVSSLYGLLSPSDLIKSYRLDFGMKGAPDGKTLSAYWKGKVTVALVRMIQESGCREVLNLLPLDASKCIDWKIVKKFAGVATASFACQGGGDELKTPSSTRLKQLRGSLLRTILEMDLDSTSSLRTLQTDSFMYHSDTPYPGNLLFVTD